MGGVLRPKRRLRVSPGLIATKLDPFLRNAEKRIAITPAEYAEAQNRLRVLKAALTEGVQERVYVNGSIEHGDAITPLKDIDLGVIIGDPVASIERQHSPVKMMTIVGEKIMNFANEHYPGMSISFAGQKRSIVVRFGGPSHSERMIFTADVIVALDYAEGQGVLVPNLLTDAWDRSDPVRHTELIRDANLLSDFSLNRVVRIAKQWNRVNGGPLSSWNIKALALACLTRPISVTEGLHTFFHFAADSLKSGLTPDPAGIASPISLEVPRSQVLRCLRRACDAIDEAIVSAESGDSSKAFHLLQAVFVFPDGKN